MKRVIKLTESDLHKMIYRLINEELDTNGWYGYPEGVDDVILTAENDRDCSNYYMGIARMVQKHFNRGEDISVERLVNSSVMKRYQQICFKKYRETTSGDGRNTRPSPFIFRQFMAQRMINDIKNGEI